MPEIDKNTLVVVLWGLMAILLLWSWLPALIATLGGSRYENGGTDDTTGMEPAANEPDYDFWHRQATAAGYEPLGKAWNRLNFFGPEWRRSAPVRIFYSRAKRTYFAIQRIGSPYNLWFDSHLATRFEDGGMLTTASAFRPDPDLDDEFVRQGITGALLSASPFERMEEMHLGTLAELLKKGRRPDSDPSLDAYLSTAKSAAGPEVKRLGGRAGWDYLLLHGIIHFCASIPAGVALGFDHWAMPFTNIMIWFLLYLSDFVQRKHIAAAMKLAMGALAKRASTETSP